MAKIFALIVQARIKFLQTCLEISLLLHDVYVKLGPLIGMFSLLFVMRVHDLMMKKVWNAMAV